MKKLILLALMLVGVSVKAQISYDRYTQTLTVSNTRYQTVSGTLRQDLEPPIRSGISHYGSPNEQGIYYNEWLYHERGGRRSISSEWTYGTGFLNNARSYRGLFDVNPQIYHTYTHDNGDRIVIAPNRIYAQVPRSGNTRLIDGGISSVSHAVVYINENYSVLESGIYRCVACRNSDDVYINIQNGEVYEFYWFEGTNTCPGCIHPPHNPNELRYQPGSQNAERIEIESSTSAYFNRGGGLFEGRAVLTDLEVISHVNEITDQGRFLNHPSNTNLRVSDGIYSVTQRRSSTINENDLANKYFIGIGIGWNVSEIYMDVRNGVIVGVSTNYGSGLTVNSYTQTFGTNEIVRHVQVYGNSTISVLLETTTNCNLNDCRSFPGSLTQYLASRTSLTSLPR